MEEKVKVKLKIFDNCIGIYNDDLAIIFNIKEDPSLICYNESKGAGFGLFSTRELVDLNNGTIQIKSNLGKESRSQFTWRENKRNYTLFNVTDIFFN